LPFIKEAGAAISGRKTIRILPNTKAARAYGASSTSELFACNYLPNPTVVRQLEAGGLVAAGYADELGPVLFEWANQEYSLAAAYLPGSGHLLDGVHPLFAGLLAAGASRASNR
jgi:CTP synthase (UTP-ammonia lyase)